MIITYHKVELSAKTNLWVSADAFNRQMADLQAYDVVTLDQYDPANPRHVVITFDGVYSNVASFAAPILEKWGYPFELFVVGDYIGGDDAFDDAEPACRFASLKELETMVQMGGRVQWRTRSHRRLDGLDDATLKRELTIPQELRSRFGSESFRWFAYPHGDLDAQAVQRVRETFVGALACDEGDDSDQHRLVRVNVSEETRFQRATVSVIVANYNYGRFLSEAVDSVLTQSVPPDEIILIDDASTDHSREVAAAYADRVKLIFNERNLGIVGNFSHAVELSRGDYIAFLGADNRMRSDYVERCRAALDRSPDAAVAYTDMTIFGPRAPILASQVAAEQIGESVAERWPIYRWSFPDPNPETLANIRQRNFIHGSSMYRRSFYDAVGGYRTTDGPEDHDLFVRMLDAGGRAIRVPHCLIEYRQHSTAQANTVLSLEISSARLRRELEHSRSINSALQESLTAANADLTSVRGELASASMAMASLQNQVETTSSSLRSALEELTLERHQREKKEIEADTHYVQLLAIQRSFSWRVTGPLRVLRRLVSRGTWALRRRAGSGLRWIFAAAPFSDRSRRRLKKLLFTAAGPLLRNTWAYQNWVAYNQNSTPALDRPALLNSAAPRGGCAPLPYSPRTHDRNSLPNLDISLVTHNSVRWLEGFFDSLVTQNYPTEKIALFIADNASTDQTMTMAHALLERHERRFRGVTISQRANDGFGGGHNHNVVRATAPFVLIANVDLKFDPEALVIAANAAIRDPDDVAAWELRQKPYEHPKYYDPVTQDTAWCSAACLLIRRKTYIDVGGFDDKIFMYGEDVELSYRLRDKGYRLRYLPRAVVWHYTYEHEGEVKPLQYTQSMLANGYLRLRYGTLTDIARLPLQFARAYRAPGPIPNHRKLVARQAGRLLLNAPHFLLRRKRSRTKFGFDGWDYELRRDGDFHAFSEEKNPEAPLITIIVRTYQGRAALLSEAVASVVNQTYDNIELLVVEDGGDEAAEFVKSVERETGLRARHIAAPKRGRSHAGNLGLAGAAGEYMMFLDDDDLLFADHVEVLVEAIQRGTGERAAYALSWQVETEFRDGQKVEHRYSIPPSHRHQYSRDALLSYNFIPIQSILFHRELYEREGGFIEHLDALEDWNLWLRYSKHTQFQFVQKITSLYRVPADDGVRIARAEYMQSFYDAARSAAVVDEAANSTATPTRPQP